MWIAKKSCWLWWLSNTLTKVIYLCLCKIFENLFNEEWKSDLLILMSEGSSIFSGKTTFWPSLKFVVILLLIDVFFLFSLYLPIPCFSENDVLLCRNNQWNWPLVWLWPMRGEGCAVHRFPWHCAARWYQFIV